MTEPLLLTVSQARSRTGGIGRDAFYGLIREGRIRVVRVGRRLLVPAGELEAFVEREAAEARPPGKGSP